VLSWGGWADNYMNTVAALVENCAGPVKGIVGPWVHQYQHTAVPGPAVGFLQIALRWWDRWLKSIENGAENDPAMRAYMIHSEAPDASVKHRAGHWVSEAVGPSPRVSRQVLALGAKAGEGCLPSPDPSRGYLTAEDDGQGFAVQVNTPQHLGMHTGEFFPMGLNAEMPGDQASDDAMSVCFDGAVLDQPLDLLGAARLSLRLSSDQPLGFIVARLCDVAPDGSSVRIAHGMLNLCHSDSMETPAPMPVGQAVDVAFNIDQMAYRLAVGHHLRLALSTTYWPFLWPSPKPATLTVTGGSLDLPVHQGSTNEWTPPEPEGAKPWAHRVLRAGKTTRKIETDLIAGTTALVIVDDLGDAENLSHGLCTGETMTELWEIRPNDPLSARAVHTWEQRLSRGDWCVKTTAWAEMTATATDLHMKARLTAYEGDQIIFDRSFDDKVPRRFI
jgi:predicted acyl esterase